MIRPIRTLAILSLSALLMTLIAMAAITQDKYKSGEPPSYHDMKFKTDLEFANLLKKEWMKTEMLPGLERDDTPKPVVMPMAEVTEEDNTALEATFAESQKVERISFLPPPPPEPEPNPFDELITGPVARTEKAAFSYFQSPVEIEYDPDLKVYIGSVINNQVISEFWANSSRGKYNDFLAGATEQRIRMGLNDWGYALFLYEVGKQIYQGSENGAYLFTWFMLVESGYDARVGYGDNQVYLLLPTGNNLYEISYFTIDGKSYYLISFDDGREAGTVYIYKGSYPDATRIIDVQLSRSPDLASDTNTRTLNFVDMGKEYSVNVWYDKNVIDFYNQYPLTDLDVYFRAPLSETAIASLVPALKPLLIGKSEAEAVNLLLHFVQTAFDYQTDDKQFGREKYFFPEEPFFYAYCDCEDRSVLFSYLVRNLIGLDVIGLDYPGHVATAVKFKDNINGDSVTYQGKRYIICDPTYINANLGMCMPSYKSTEPIVIPIRT